MNGYGVHMRILIVDDDVVDQMAISRALPKKFVISQAESVKMARRELDATSFDCVIVDYSMPLQKGTDLISKFNSYEKVTPAIVMVSHSDEKNIEYEALSQGAHEFLCKSELSQSSLVNTIDKAVTRARYINDARLRHREAHEDANTDSLCNIRNRRGLNLELADIEGVKGSYELVVIDVDNFKEINDTFGHLVGDQVLRFIANKLSAMDSDNLITFRLGGDEFGVLKINGDSIDGKVAESLELQLQQEIKRGSINLKGIDISFSTSLGIAKCIDQIFTWDQLYDDADQNLYHLKKSLTH